MKKKKDLKNLIRHIALHSNYPDCGYFQMTTEQKALFDRINRRRTPGVYERFDDDQRRRYDKIRGKHGGEVQA